MRSAIRISLTFFWLLAAWPLFAQGTENAIEAAVLFGAVVLATLFSGLVISVLYLFQRRRWQRVVVVLFGITLLCVSLWIGMQEGSSGDMDFLKHLLGAGGIFFLVVATFLKTQEKEAVPSA